MLTKPVYLEIDKPNYVPIYTVQYDYNSRFYEITILNNSQPLDLTGIRVIVAGKKPDGKEVFNSCKVLDAKKGLIQLELTEQMNAVNGASEYALELFSADGMLSSQPFKLIVTRSTISKSVESSKELGALKDALNEVQDIDNRFAQTNAQLSAIKEHCTGGNGVQEHSHFNKSVIDKLSDHDGKLYYDGEELVQEIKDGTITLDKIHSSLLDDTVFNCFENVYLVDGVKTQPLFTENISVSENDSVKFECKVYGQNMSSVRIFLWDSNNQYIVKTSVETIQETYAHHTISGNSLITASSIKIVIALTFKNDSVKSFKLSDLFLTINGVKYDLSQSFNGMFTYAENTHDYIHYVQDFIDERQPARKKDLNLLDNEVQSVKSRVDVLESINSNSKTKKWLAWGDSITEAKSPLAGGGYCRLLNDGIKYNITNNGVGGSSTMGLWSRVQGIGDIEFDPNTLSDYDIITIMIGTNYSFGGFELDTSILDGNYMNYPNNFLYNMCKTIEFILERKKEDARLVILTPPKHFRASQIGDQTETYTVNKTLAQFYSIPCIDVNANCEINVGNYQKYLYDELHPNELGYTKIAKVIDKGLDSIF